MPHWQNVEITAEGEPAATVIKSQDNNTFIIRDRASDSCEEGRQHLQSLLCHCSCGNADWNCTQGMLMPAPSVIA